MFNALVPLTNLDRMMDEFFAPTFSGNGHDLELTPRADVLEGEREFQIRLEMPGVRKDDLDIHVEDDLLTIGATRNGSRGEGFQALRNELPRHATFKRTFRLGSEVEADKITARLEDGILTLSLPKSAKALPRRIEIK